MPLGPLSHTTEICQPLVVLVDDVAEDACPQRSACAELVQGGGHDREDLRSPMAGIRPDSAASQPEPDTGS